MRAKKALEFLWSGQDGLFELASAVGGQPERHLYTKAHALSSLAGHERFGPLARRDDANAAGDVASTGNVLWADIDERDGLDDRLAKAPVPPSLLIDSGRSGYWAYWKLTRPIPADQIEQWNRGLARRLGADGGASTKEQLARLPGSYRHETGRFAEVVRFSGKAYEPELLESLAHADRLASWRRLARRLIAPR